VNLTHLRQKNFSSKRSDIAQRKDETFGNLKFTLLTFDFEPDVRSISKQCVQILFTIMFDVAQDFFF
jgi:hypothetical protein